MAEIVGINNDSKPRDLLKRFVCDFSTAKESFGGGGGENIELSLGLSLNGRFGVDPQKGNSLIRSSSSVSNFLMMSNDESAFTLTRTCSLPSGAEEVWRKRKEVQSLRRMEAKRKRVEKMKNNGRGLVKGRGQEAADQSSDDNGRGSVVNNGSEGVELKSVKLGVEGVNRSQVLSQGSIGSQGSSGISDFESQPIRGTNGNVGDRSPLSEQSQPGHKPAASLANGKPTKAENGPSAAVRNDQKVEMVRNIMMEDMPCVTTKVEGPDGKRIEGFLYRYMKGEEVKIMCVCHGDFHSPAEFVKHGGGGDVENPLKHIVICPTPF